VILATVIALLWSGPVDPCASVDGVGATNHGQSAMYLAIGDEELAGGARETATIAYQTALRHDPGNARARKALIRLCHEARAGQGAAVDGFAEALTLMERGQRRQAAAAFEAVRVAEHDTAAALLEGVCLFDLGDDARAQALLREAAADDALAASARFFLGLIALRSDDKARATELLGGAAASDNRNLREAAIEILSAARREGRLVASLLSEVGFDSNVALTPDGSPSVPSSRDGAVSETAGVFWRPLGRSGPYARAAGQYRKQFQLDAYDLGTAGGALGWRQGQTGTFAAAEYAYDFFSLGGASYLSAHRLAIDGHLNLNSVTLAASTSARFESYLQDQTADYSGLRLSATIDAAVRLASGLTAACGYQGAHDEARLDSLRYWQHGPTCRAAFSAGATVRFIAEAGLTFRRYAAPDALLGGDRRDRFIDGVALGEWDLSLGWTTRLTVTGRKASSTIADPYSYTKVTVTLGAAYTFGFL
jgi:hypothetical protein